MAAQSEPETVLPEPEYEDVLTVLQPPHQFWGHGLFYIERNGGASHDLLTEDPSNISRPERDVLQALLTYVLDQLKNPWDRDDV